MLQAVETRAARIWAPPQTKLIPPDECWRCAPPGIGYSLGAGGRAARAATITSPTTTGLTGWFREDVIIATGVSQWTDKSGNARHMTQGTGSAQPSFESTGGPNGTSCLAFDFVDDCVRGAAVSNHFAAATGWAYSVHKHNSLRTNAASSFNNQPVWTDVSAFMGVHLKSVPTILAYNYDGSDDHADAATGAAGTWYVVTWKHAGGNLYVRVNAGAFSAATASGDTGTMTGALDVGSQSGVAGSMDGRIAELITYNADLSAADDATNLSYLQSRYALW